MEIPQRFPGLNITIQRITLLLQCDWTILLPVLNISSNFMDNPYILTMNSTYRLDMDNKDFYMASFPKFSDFLSSVDFPHQTMDYAISVIYLVAMGMHLLKYLNDRMVYIHDSKFTKPISSSELVQTEV
jgi:hypothetical protein